MNLVKGFKDVVGNEAEKRALIKEVLKQTFERYGFMPAETPIVEYEEFVKGENLNDSAVRDIFKLQDRGKRKLALRYEFTFQLKRLAKNQKLPFRRYQIGDVFRDEPIRPGRLRQFTQCDADIVGSTVKDEAECFSILKEVLDSLKIKFTLYINNRKLINEILDENNVKNKEQVIREIDKLDKFSIKEVKSNLKKYKAEKILEIFTQKEKYFEKYEAYKEVKELKYLCSLFGVDVEFRPFLARGLSYYNGTVFEVWSKDLNVSVCGGGSYLINEIQATGISFGLEPLILLTNIVLKIDKILIVSLNQDKAAIQLAKKLRKQGRNTTIFYGKPSKALEYANSYGLKQVLFVGAKEVKTKKFKVKIMKTGRESILKI
tara:strand:+ start:637 stop:1761 length:1125 start_codon:yes stop_codon:yes gene_type:complete